MQPEEKWTVNSCQFHDIVVILTNVLVLLHNVVIASSDGRDAEVVAYRTSFVSCAFVDDLKAGLGLEELTVQTVRDFPTLLHISHHIFDGS